MLNNNYFCDLITTCNKFYNNNYINEKKYLKKISPKIGKVYLVRLSINSLSFKYSNFLSKNFLGRCIFVRRKNSNTSLFCLRNVYNKYPIEVRFFTASPSLLKLRLFKLKEKKFRRNKLYFFKKISVFKSRV